MIKLLSLFSLIFLLFKSHLVWSTYESQENHASCEFLSEVLYVFRASYGYSRDPKAYLKRVAYIFEDLLARSTLWFGKNTRLGIVTYQDKPAEYFGLPGNKCAQLSAPLTNLSILSHYKDFNKYVKLVEIKNTGEDGDGAVDGIIRGALHEGVGWSKENVDPVTKLPIRRIIILVTDIYPHLGRSLYFSQPRYIDLIKDFNKTVCVKDINALCEEMDFPSREDISTILTERNISLFIVTWRATRIPKVGGWPKEEYGVPGEVFHYLAHQGYSVWQIGGYFSPRDDFVAIFYDDLLNKSTVRYKNIIHNSSNLHDPPTGALIREQLLKWFYPNESCSKQNITYPPISVPYVEDISETQTVQSPDIDKMLPKNPSNLDAYNARNSRSHQSLIAGGVAGVIALAGIGVVLGRNMSGTFPGFSRHGDRLCGSTEPGIPCADTEPRDQVAQVTQELYT